MTHLSSRISIGEPNQPASSTHNARTYIIYYITGNPGLIEYYRTFLVHLYGLLQHKYLNAGASGRHVDFEIHGRSLAGFEVDASGSHKKGGVTGPPYNVNQQIEFTIQDIKDTVKAVRAKRTGGDVRLILMGHSLGTYLSLEVMRLLREEAAEAGVHDDTGCVRVVGAVLLFATIMNLAKSPSGVKTSWLLSLPHFAWCASLFARGLTFFIPTAVLSMLIQILMGFPADAARVTAEFVKSPHGVEQALFLANDEMREISVDKWDADIWGAAHPSAHPHPRPTLRFLFAKTDHWVANETRDELIRARGMAAAGEEDWKPKMEVDEEEGWPHGFCIKHSVPLADRVSGYIEDIVERDLQEP